MSDRDWEVMIGRLIVYRKGWRWTVMWRSGRGQWEGGTGYTYRRWGSSEPR